MGTQLRLPNRARKSVGGSTSLSTAGRLNRTSDSSQIGFNSTQKQQQSQRFGGGKPLSDEFLASLKKIGVIVNPNSPNDAPLLEHSMNDVLCRVTKLTVVEQHLFLTQLGRFCEDTYKLRILLSPSKINAEHGISDGCDSVLCILFRADSIQSEIGILLLNKLFLYQDDVEMRNLLHAQLRMPEYIVQDEKFFACLLETMNKLKGAIQCSLIENVPEIVIGAEQHERCAENILTQMQDNKNIVKAGLAALSLLDIKNAKNLSEIRTGVCNKLPEYMDQDLPSALTFLLKTCDSESISEIISHLRSDDFDLFWRLSRGSSRFLTENRLDVAVINEFRRFFRLNTGAVLNESLNAICDVRNTFNVFDLMFLLIGCHVNEMDLTGGNTFGKESKIPTALFKKIPDFVGNIHASDAIDGLLEKAFLASDLFLYRKFYDFVITIAGQMLKNRNEDRQRFGAKILQHLFVSFDREDERYRIDHMTVRRKSLEELLSHLTDFEHGCTGIVIEGVKNILTVNPAQIIAFSVLFMNILDNTSKLVKLPLDSVRKIFEMLVSFGQECRKLEDSFALGNEKGTVIMDKLHLFIEKCLLSVEKNTKCKSIGLLGSIILLKNIQTDISFSPSDRRKVSNLQTTITRERQRCPLMDALYLEEISAMIGASKDNSNLIQQSLMGKDDPYQSFKQQFLTDKEDIQESYGSVNSRLLLQLPGSRTALNVLSVVFSNDLRAADRLIGLLGRVKLIQDLHRNKDTHIDLLDIDIVICSEETIELMKTSDNPQFVRKICTLFFHCANWIRHVVSTACDQEGMTEMKKVRVVKFLDALVDVEKTLVDCLNYAHKWQVPVVWCLSQQPEICISGFSDQPVAVKRKPKPKNKKRKVNESGNETTMMGEEEQEQEVVVEERKTIRIKDSKDFPPSSVGRFLKEISFSVHSLMQLHNNMNGDTFMLLLKDMNAKIGNVLPKTNRRGPPIKSVLNKDNFELAKVFKNDARFKSVIEIATKSVVQQLKKMKTAEVSRDRSFDAEPMINSNLLSQCLTFLTTLFKKCVGDDSNRMWREQLMKCISDRNDDKSAEELTRMWLTLLLSFEKNDIEDVRIGAALVQLCMLFSDMIKDGADESREKIGQLAHKYVVSSWDDQIKGNANHLKGLIETNIISGKDRLSSALTLANEVLSQTDNEQNDSTFVETEYKSFSPQTVDIYMNVLLERLVVEAKETRFNNYVALELSKRWCILVKLASLLVSVCILKLNEGNRQIMKRLHSPRMCRMIVRYSYMLLKYFLDKKMGVSVNGLDHFVHVINSDDDKQTVLHAVAGIKSMQRICRTLHIICTHIKKTKLQVCKLAELNEMCTVLNNRVERALTKDYGIQNQRVKERNLEGDSLMMPEVSADPLQEEQPTEVDNEEEVVDEMEVDDDNSEESTSRDAQEEEEESNMSGEDMF